MPSYPFVTVDVFTDRRFGGNPLAVVPRRERVVRRRHAVARRRVQPQRDDLRPAAEHPANTARVRIFTRPPRCPLPATPMSAPACPRAQGRDRGGVLRFEEIAGLVEVRVDRDAAGA